MLNIGFLLLMLLGAVGAWRQWRRSPMFSAKIAIEVVAGVAVTIAAIVGAAYVMPDPNNGASQTLAIGSYLGFIVLLTSGLIAFIIHVSAGRVPTPPPSAPNIRVHRDKLTPWIVGGIGLLIVLAVAVAFLPGDLKLLPITFGGLLLLLAAALLVPLYMNARRMDRGVAVLMADPWAHWRYRPEHWRAWVADRRAVAEAAVRQTDVRRNWRGLLWMVGGLAVAALIIGEGGLLARLWLFLGCTAFMVVVLALIYWGSQGNPARVARRLLAAPAEAWLGPAGALIGRDYSPWGLGGCYLAAAGLRREPSGVCIVLRFIVSDGTGSRVVEQHVPLPDDATPDLAALQAKLSGACPKAAVAIA